MKITQFILTLGTGGAEAVVRDYALELKKRGHDVTVVVLLPFLHKNNEKVLSDADVTLRSVYEEIFISKSLSPLMRAIRKPFRDKKVRKWICSYLNTEKPDVFHVHLELLRFIPESICAKNSTKLFYTCHNEASYYFGNKVSSEYEYAKKLIKTDNLRFFALHARMKEELNLVFSINNTEVMNNPVDLNRFSEEHISPEDSRKLLALNPDDFVIGHVGRFNNQKNHSFLINIFSEVKKIKPNAKLVMAGDGDLRPEIENKCAVLGLTDSVLFLGNRKDIPDILPAFDIFLFPSLFEGLPVSLIEAQNTVPYCVASAKIALDTAVTAHCAFIPLEAPVSVWADAVLNPQKYTVPKVNNLEDFDIVNVVNRLETFYDQEKNPVSH